MTDELDITATEADQERKRKFLERYTRLPVESVGRLLLADMLLVGDSSKFTPEEFGWAFEYAEAFLNVRR